MGLRKIALEGCRLNARKRERREYERQARVGIAVCGEDRSLRLLHAFGQTDDVLVAAVEGGLARFGTARFGRTMPFWPHVWTAIGLSSTAGALS